MSDLPTIEQIYNYYHKCTFYIMKGTYPKSIKNFDNILTDDKKELLLKFQNFLKRNGESLDWKLYIYSIAKILKFRYNLNLLGSMKGTRIYRDYVKIISDDKLEIETIKNLIIESLQNINQTIKDYQLDNLYNYYQYDKMTLPLSLRQIYSGKVSLYLYGCFTYNMLVDILDYPLDVFDEVLDKDKTKLIDDIMIKRSIILSNSRLRSLVIKVDGYFNSSLKNK